MRIFEVESQFNPYLVEFWKTRTPEQLRSYFIQDNCIDASNDFLEFLESNRIMTAEVVPTGQMTGNKKKYGWIKVDEPVYEEDALTNQEIAEMRKLGLNSANPQDIKQYAEHKGITEELTWIPHSWVEIRGQILDPSGFYIDGKSGQFDRLVQNKTNLSSRYRYFP